MMKTGDQSYYRTRLDKSLASPELQDQETLKILVRNQLQCSFDSDSKGCNEMMVWRRTSEVSSILDLLRSASSHNNTSKRSEWKLKEEKKEYRVMYRPGPEGSPLHSLLVDGFIDSPLDHCLCVTWESALYSRWWPQFSVPPFKVTRNEVLQRLRLGEHLSLVRMKLPWPLSSREAVLHFFLFEFVKEDLVLAVFNSISESDDLSQTINGFTKDCIPEVNDVVRIGVLGCCVLQKISPDRTYTRTIANVDTKLNFFPPSLVNFISRSVIAKGFKLYQKIVSSVCSDDEDFSKALMDPMYERIRTSLYEQNRKGDANVDGDRLKHLSLREDLNKDTSHELDEPSVLISKNYSDNSLNGSPEFEDSRVEDEIEGELFYDSSSNGFTYSGAKNCEIEEEENGNGSELIHLENDANGRQTIINSHEENKTRQGGF